jgi:hypothetical protein
MLQRSFSAMYVLTLTAMLFIALMLGGCDVLDNIAGLFSTDAQAQQEKRIETFRISVDSLVILTTSTPTVVVSDGATTYTQLDGTITFTTSANSQENFVLKTSDTVIERPAAGTLTIIRDN